MKTRLLGSYLSSKLTMFGALAAAVLISSTSFADVNGTSNGGGTFFPDNDSGGLVSTVTILDSEIIQNARFVVEGLQHTWIGDLIITVAHSGGKSATLMNRVGTTSNPTSTGDDSNVNGTYEFGDGNGSIWTAASNGDTSFTVPGGSYDASGVNEALVSLDSIFAGENTAGTWTFNISDNNGTQFGSYTQTRVDFTSAAAVPEAGTMATVVLGTLFGGVYFRRRRQKNNSEESTTEECVA